MSATCKCNPLRPHGCAADECANNASYRDRREKIATKVLAGLVASPNKFTYNGQSSQDSDDAGPTLVACALSLTDRFIAELDRA